MTSGVYKRTNETREAIRQARLGVKASSEARKNMSIAKRKQALDESWKLRVSLGTQKAMHRPEVRRRHLAGLEKAIRKHGANFKGGTNQRPVKFVREMWKVLKPLGYVREHIVKGILKGSGRRYTLDFALVDKKIAIECDGPKHRPYKQKAKDRQRDAILKSHGWKTIRVPHD